MSHFAKMSEAASVALHAALLMAKKPRELHTARSIAEGLTVSEATLAKVLQRLARAGIVDSTRGPKGGFVLAKNPADVTLLSVYEAIEGTLTPTRCLLSRPVCGGECLLSALLSDVDVQARNFLAGKNLADVAAALPVGGSIEDIEKAG